MRTAEELESELDTLVAGNYYTEDYELRWTIRRFEEGLEPAEKRLFREIALRRLTDDPSILSVMLVSAVPVPDAVPVLAALLDRTSGTDMLTRAVLSTLAAYGESSAVPSVTRFLDSDQEIEALTCLARLHFGGSLFYVFRSARRDHLRGACLQILHARKKEVGLERLIGELGAHQASSRQNVPKRLGQILGSKEGPYNPFTAEEIAALGDGVK
jgi:hypothetical protein